MATHLRITSAGDAAILAELSDSEHDREVDLDVNARAIALAAAVLEFGVSGVLDVVPAFRTVGVYFDPFQVDRDRVTGLVQEAYTCLTDVSFAIEGTLHRIPVCYGGSFGPDLAEVATAARLTEDAVVSAHSRSIQHVFMLGFMPGFAYMGPLDPAIAIGRRETPRTSVPAGSVAVANGQTGIYPAAGPGGWQLIGRTWIKPFDQDRAEPLLFKAGDRVQFYPVPADAFGKGL